LSIARVRARISVPSIAEETWRRRPQSTAMDGPASSIARVSSASSASHSWSEITSIVTTARAMRSAARRASSVEPAKTISSA
jgi:hypothetical protein